MSDLRPLAGLRQLRAIDLMDTCVEDVESLGTLEMLDWLRLDGTAVSDLTPLANLKKLESVRLSKGREIRIPKQILQFIYLV